MNVHSSQLGLLAIVSVSCLLSDLRLGFSMSRRMSSWRFDGGSVNMMGMEEVMVVDGALNSWEVWWR